jgi:hypothetical protein
VDTADGARLTLEQGDRLAERTLAMIDASEEGLRRAAGAVVSERHDADRQRVASDLDGLRRVDPLVGSGELRATAADLLRPRSPPACSAPLPSEG